MTYPTVRAQVAFDTDPLDTPSWTTIHEGTATQRAITATTRTGRQFELDPFQPGRMTLKLDNIDRRFDPLHAAGPYFGKLLPRKRTRLQADWGSYLNLTGLGSSEAYTLDHASLRITGDIDLRARIAPSDWTPAANMVVMGRADLVGGFSYALGVTTAGNIQIAWSPTGALGALLTTDSTAAVSASDGETRWVRVTLDVNDGGGNRVVRFYTSTDDTHDHSAVSWTQLGSTVTTAGTTSIFAGSNALIIGQGTGGFSLFTGKVYAAAVLNGIAGTVVADPDFTDGNRFTAGGTSGTDSIGREWTVASPATLVAVTYDLFSGFVDTWPQDSRRFTGVSEMTATDGFKVLSRIDLAGAYEATVRDDSPSGWWRLGDNLPASSLCADSSGNGHDGYYRGSPAGVDSIVDGTADGAVDFDGINDRVLLDIAALPPTGSGGPSSVAFTVECWFQTTMTLSTAALVTAHCSEGTYSGFIELQQTFGLYLNDSEQLAAFTTNTGGNGVVIATSASYADGLAHHAVMTYEGAGDRKIRIYVDGSLVATSVAQTAAALAACDGLRIGTWHVGDARAKRFDGIIDEVALYDSALTADQVLAHYKAGADPWTGDTTGERIDRVLTLAGWPAADRDLDTGKSVMGPYLEAESNALSIVQRAEATEGGALWQAPDGAITFRDRHTPIQDWNATVSQATFTDDDTATDPQHYTVLDLAYDDTLIVNEAAVTWVDGVETSRDQTSVVAYTRAAVRVETALTTAPEARDRGDWLLARYKNPAVRPDRVVLRPAADDRLWRHCLARRIGDRVTVRRTPQNTGTAIQFDATIESINHRVADGINTWETEFGLSPTAVDLGWLILDDTAKGLLDTGRLAF